jgi:hypothetical protein
MYPEFTKTDENIYANICIFISISILRRKRKSGAIGWEAGRR